MPYNTTLTRGVMLLAASFTFVTAPRITGAQQSDTSTAGVNDPVSSLIPPWGQSLPYFASRSDSSPVYAAPMYSRYREIGQCLAATLRRTSHYWRDKRPDTLVYDPLHTEPLPHIRDSARVCTAQLPTNQVLSDDALIPALKLALITGESSRIMDITNTIRARIRTIPKAIAAQVLRNMVQSYLDAHPACPDSALAYARLLDSLGPSVAIEQLSAYGVIAKFAYTVGDVALSTAMAKETMGFMRASRMSVDDRLDWADPLLESYWLGAKAAALDLRDPQPQRDLDSAMFLFQTELPRANQGAIRSRVLGWQNAYRNLGQVAPPIRGQYWFNTDGDTAAFPRRGVVTFVYASRMPAGIDQYPVFSILRRLGKKFAGQKFQIVLLSFTQGRVYNHLVPNEDHEAESIRRYFLEFLKVPATLAIERSRFSTMESGLRNMAPLVNSRFYAMGPVFDATVIGKDGRVVYLESFSEKTELALEAAIQAALDAPMSASSAIEKAVAPEK